MPTRLNFYLIKRRSYKNFKPAYKRSSLKLRFPSCGTRHAESLRLLLQGAINSTQHLQIPFMPMRSYFRISFDSISTAIFFLKLESRNKLSFNSHSLSLSLLLNQASLICDVIRVSVKWVFPLCFGHLPVGTDRLTFPKVSTTTG